jgi:hypothetical protein
LDPIMICMSHFLRAAAAVAANFDPSTPTIRQQFRGKVIGWLETIPPTESPSKDHYPHHSTLQSASASFFNPHAMSASFWPFPPQKLATPCSTLTAAKEGSTRGGPKKAMDGNWRIIGQKERQEGDILSSARWNLILSGRPASSSSALLCVAMSSDQCQEPKRKKMNQKRLLFFHKRKRLEFEIFGQQFDLQLFHPLAVQLSNADEHIGFFIHSLWAPSCLLKRQVSQFESGCHGP